MVPDEWRKKEKEEKMKLLGSQRGGTETLMEVIYLIVMFCFFGLPFAFFKMWWWFFFVLSIVVSFGIFEFLRHKKTGKTLSNRYLKMRKNSPVQFWIVTSCMIIFWAMLVAHLGWDVPGRFF